MPVSDRFLTFMQSNRETVSPKYLDQPAIIEVDRLLSIPVWLNYSPERQRTVREPLYIHISPECERSAPFPHLVGFLRSPGFFLLYDSTRLLPGPGPSRMRFACNLRGPKMHREHCPRVSAPRYQRDLRSHCDSALVRPDQELGCIIGHSAAQCHRVPELGPVRDRPAASSRDIAWFASSRAAAALPQRGVGQLCCCRRSPHFRSTCIPFCSRSKPSAKSAAAPRRPATHRTLKAGPDLSVKKTVPAAQAETRVEETPARDTRSSLRRRSEAFAQTVQLAAISDVLRAHGQDDIDLRVLGMRSVDQQLDEGGRFVFPGIWIVFSIAEQLLELGEAAICLNSLKHSPYYMFQTAIQVHPVVDPISWTRKQAFLRWWAALKNMESQCLAPERIIRRA